MVNENILFESLDDVLEWIKNNDDPKNFGYRILCDTNFSPVKWTIEKQIISHNHNGDKIWITI